jgi:hypothetical protein
MFWNLICGYAASIAAIKPTKKDIVFSSVLSAKANCGQKNPLF